MAFVEVSSRRGACACSRWVVGDAVSAPSPGEASVRIPTVRIPRLAHVLCRASVGAPSAASRVEWCIVAQCWGMGEATTRRRHERARHGQEERRAYLCWESGPRHAVGAAMTPAPCLW